MARNPELALSLLPDQLHAGFDISTPPILSIPNLLCGQTQYIMTLGNWNESDPPKLPLSYLGADLSDLT